MCIRDRRRPVKLFQIVIILHHIQPCVHRLLILPAGGKLLRQFHTALLLGLTLGLVAIEKLDAEAVSYTHLDVYKRQAQNSADTGNHAVQQKRLQPWSGVKRYQPPFHCRWDDFGE